ncbi:MAG: hypothetical protein WD225_08265 [Ilumatobacteraceae bacterium]
MPPRKRPKSTSSSASPSTPDPVARFAAALRDSDAREDAERERQREQQAAAEQLAEARRDLQRAIDDARAARRRGSGVPEADATWRAAKARVIELETGAPPEWAPAEDAGPAADEVDTDDEQTP